MQGAGLLHEMDGEERGCAGLLAGASEEVWEVYSRIGQSVWGAASSSWDGRKLYSIMERGADSLVGAQEAVEELQDRCSLKQYSTVSYSTIQCCVTPLV